MQTAESFTMDLPPALHQAPPLPGPDPPRAKRARAAAAATAAPAPAEKGRRDRGGAGGRKGPAADGKAKAGGVAGAATAGERALERLSDLARLDTCVTVCTSPHPPTPLKRLRDCMLPTCAKGVVVHYDGVSIPAKTRT